MKMSRNFVILSVVVSAAVLAAFVAPCSATPINYLVNGDFEIGSATSVGPLPSGENPADLANWTVSSPNGDWFYDVNPGSYPPDVLAESGTKKLMCAGGGTSASYVLSDAFPVTAGVTYTVSYWDSLRSSSIRRRAFTRLLPGPAG